MGYTTYFEGHINIVPALNPHQVKYLQTFQETRRMKRSNAVLTAMYKGEHGLDGKYGNYGEYFAKDDGESGQSQDESILNYNEPPPSQPGLWCQWRISDDGTRIEWDDGEKFYGYVEWMRYIINHFIKPWGSVANGEIEWDGEGFGDHGTIIVKDNIVKTK